ncbi:AzlD domain-containing protein [Pelagibacterium xiamenense]|uniref:AzlD domain-containing protein n=1 Tax=Pelagibacterium xiamenense TaxID=2901140 RepID=UPI001E344B1B|nr:AzlD domain-containing protein [Pelagibacterium xiamenense]MCD7058707.1 AzlD domain-containing protein [Pelagibacterium xiamenense]
MNADLVIITLIVGIGTWVFRVLPTKIDLTAGRPGGPVSRFLAATGPAAIAALFAVSFLPMLEPDMTVLAPVAIGIAATVAGFAFRRDVALATVFGAIAYGLAYALIAM